MPIDTSIITRGMNRVEMEPRSNALARLLQVQGAQQQQEMNALKMDEYRRGLEDQNQLRSALSAPGADPYSVLLQRGNVKEATEFAKGKADLKKSDVETENRKQDTKIKQYTYLANVLKDVKDQTGYQTAYQLAEAFGMDMNGIPTAYNPRFVETARGAFTTEVQKWTDQRAREQMAETGRHNLRTEGLTARGQNMADARAKETAAASLSKPFEITGEDGKPVLVQQDKQGNIRPVQGYLPKQGASKPLNEGQSKALLFGSRMQEANSIFDELEAVGKTKSVPGSSAPIIGGAITAMSGEKNQKLEQAKRDFINATLRRESGAAIAASEFDNAERQYFPQIGDTPAVISQKKRNREVATRGILAEVPDSDNRVSKVRGAAPASTNIDALLNKYK